MVSSHGLHSSTFDVGLNISNQRELLHFPIWLGQPKFGDNCHAQHLRIIFYDHLPVLRVLSRGLLRLASTSGIMIQGHQKKRQVYLKSQVSLGHLNNVLPSRFSNAKFIANDHIPNIHRLRIMICSRSLFIRVGILFS